MRIFFLFWALASALVPWAGGPAFASSVSRVAAVVNGEIITLRQLERLTEREARQRNLAPDVPGDAAQIDMLARELLEILINEKILVQEAGRRGITVTDSMLDAEVEQVIKDSQLSRDEFLRQLDRQGLGLDELRERLRVAIVTRQLISRQVFSRVVVTSDEINDYYRRNKDDIPSGRVRIALIVYPAGENAENLASRIANGSASFAEMARAVSVGPNAARGGDMGFIALEDLAPALRTEVENLTAGEISGLFEMQINQAQVQLLEVAASSRSDSDVPDAAVAARIEEMLRQPRLEARFAEYTAQLRSRALVDIRY